ncbi:unnamed protein product [Ophioblennius macclurei]
MSQSHVTSPAHVRHYGLLNQGATCYLNSLLQALFMTKDFKEAVRTHEKQETINPELSALFDGLEKDTTSTCRLTKKLGIDRVCEQRDAAEYFEKILQQTSPEASRIFHGKLVNRTTCLVCKAETNTDAPFWHLPLQIGNKSFSVEDGIKEFFKLSELKGDSQMYCEMCDNKVDGTLGYVMTDHPDVLVLLLKRFNFSYQYMSYIKNNQPVAIPNFLEKSIEPLKGSTYELYAVVDHFGDLRSGHYVTKVKTEDDDEHRWYNFDDTTVTPVDAQVLQENLVKSQNAYLLFYRKQTKSETPDVTNGSFPQNGADREGQSQDGDKSGKKEEDGEEVERLTSPVSNNPQTDLDRRQEDEIKETREREDAAGNVNARDSRENGERATKDSEEDADTKREADGEVGGRRSACGPLEKQDERSDTRKRKMSADTDEDESEEVKRGKSGTDHSDTSAEHQSDKASGGDANELEKGEDFTAKAASEEEGENSAKSTDVDVDGELSADKVTSEEIAAHDQRSQQDAQKLQTEQNEGCVNRSDCVRSNQREQTDGFSAAENDAEKQQGREGDLKEIDLKEKSTESEKSPTESQDARTDPS